MMAKQIIEKSSELGAQSSELGKAALLKILLNKRVKDQLFLFERRKVWSDSPKPLS